MFVSLNSLPPNLPVTLWRRRYVHVHVVVSVLHDSNVKALQRNSYLRNELLDPVSLYQLIFIHIYMYVQDYYDFQEEHRSSLLNSLSRKYHAIGPLLIKVEGLVVQTNTGKSPRLARYYEHWEKKVFESLVKVRIVETSCTYIPDIYRHVYIIKFRQCFWFLTFIYSYVYATICTYVHVPYNSLVYTWI